MFAGPMFALARKNKGQKPFEDFGISCQSYAFHLLRTSNEQRQEEHRCDVVVNEPKGTPRPLNDILIGHGDTAALIEAKGVWLKDALLYETEPDILWEAVREKYAVLTSNGKGSKGVGQLAEVIQGVISGSVVPASGESLASSAQEFIPILVAQDALIANVVFSNHLVSEFGKFMGINEPPPDGSFPYAGKIIHSLIVLSIYDLEVLACADSSSSLLAVLKDFSRKVPLRLDSVTNFLKHPSQQMRWRRSVVHERAEDLLDRTGTECFGAQYTGRQR
jgi:hypothetical protein